jgi:dTMP kinase
MPTSTQKMSSFTAMFIRDLRDFIPPPYVILSGKKAKAPYIKYRLIMVYQRNHTMDILKNFTVFEGLDGSGTTTQLKLLKNRFEGANSSLPSLYNTFEPTEGNIGRLIRSGLRGEIPIQSATMAMLFAADRNEHLYAPGGIAERCGRGELVVSDRYVLSSLVYQGITCGDELPALLNKGFPAPQQLLFFDLDPTTAQKRMEDRELKEIYERLDFQMKVRERYLALLPGLEARGVRVKIIDASEGPEKVAEEVWRVLEKLPIFSQR